MEVLFNPAEKQLTAAAAKRRNAAEMADDVGAEGEGGDESMEGVFGGTLAIRRRWESKKQEESKAFSCMLWCTIALGAMTSNLELRTVRARGV